MNFLHLCYICDFLLIPLFDLHYQALLVSGGSDGLLVLWNADYGQDSRELVPKLSLKVIAFIFTQYFLVFLYYMSSVL